LCTSGWINPLFSTFGIQFSGIEGYESAMFKKLFKFLREVKLELKKVSWPSRREISGSTGVVIVSVAIAAVYLGIVDAILQQIMLMLH
jgi:preprotein translocase subunit SecE